MTPQPLLRDTFYFDHMCQVKCIAKCMTSSPLWGGVRLCFVSFALCKAVLCPVSFAPFASYAPLLRLPLLLISIYSRNTPR